MKKNKLFNLILMFIVLFGFSLVGAGSAFAYLNLNKSNIYQEPRIDVEHKAFQKMSNPFSYGDNYMTPKLFDSYYYNVVNTEYRKDFLNIQNYYSGQAKETMANDTCVFFDGLGG